MRVESSPESGTLDRRVRRSRAALMAAAVRLVSERGTTDIPVTDLAEAADVSRRLVYLQFGDRDALVVAAAADLVDRELVTRVGVAAAGIEPVLALARHFAGHRSFYRAVLTGSCGFAMTRRLTALFNSANRSAVRELFGELDEDTTRDLTVFLAAGTGGIVHDWLVDGEDPLDPEHLAHRLLRLQSAFVDRHRLRTDGGHLR